MQNSLRVLARIIEDGRTTGYVVTNGQKKMKMNINQMYKKAKSGDIEGVKAQQGNEERQVIVDNILSITDIFR